MKKRRHIISIASIVLVVCLLIWPMGVGAVTTQDRALPQITSLANVKNGMYILQNVATGRWLDTASWPAASGDRAVTWYSNTTSNVYWQLLGTSDGYFRLKPFSNTIYMLDLYNNWDSEGNTVGVGGYTGYPAQKWKFIANGDGSFRIQSQASSTRVLASTDNDECIISTYTGANHMKWKLFRVTAYYKQSGNSEWSLTNLNNTYFTGYNSNTNVLSLMGSEGCYLSAYAMVIKNTYFDSNSSFYDNRFGTTSYAKADPYTVLLANNNYPSITYSGGKYWINKSGNPLAVAGATIAGKYGLTVSKIDRGSRTVAQWAQTITQAANENPEGILARFSNHTIVITGSTYGQTASTYNLSSNQLQTEELPWEPLTEDNQHLYSGEYDDLLKSRICQAIGGRQEIQPFAKNTSIDSKFTVCDPANGNHVPLTSCYAYNQYGGIDDILFIQRID